MYQQQINVSKFVWPLALILDIGFYDGHPLFLLSKVNMEVASLPKKIEMMYFRRHTDDIRFSFDHE